MDTIMDIIIFTIGFAVGLVTCLIAWLRTISVSITKINIEIAKLQAELESEDI